MTISTPEVDKEQKEQPTDGGKVVREHHAQVREKKARILSPYFVFSILLIPRLLAAQFSIIGDCDEGETDKNG
jgi:hypothetical protein